MLDVLQHRFDVQDAGRGTVLGPRSFVAYDEDVTEIFYHHHVRHYLFADELRGKPVQVCLLVRRSNTSRRN